MQRRDRPASWKLALAVLALVTLVSAIERPNESHAAANPYKLCVYKSGDDRVTYVHNHEQWLGRKFDAVLDFIPRDTWQNIKYPLSTIRAWAGTPYDVVFTIPMLPKDGSTLQAGANGAYDANWRAFAKTFIDEGRPNAIIRLGHEFNHTWYPWTATNGKEAAFAAYWRRIVNAVRSVPGAKFRFTWNVLSNAWGADVVKAYPGDAYVDYVGLDLYDGVYGVTDFNERWNRLRTQKYGLDWFKSFASAHNKPMAFDEWALVYSNNPEARDPKTNSGDDTVYINKMLDFFGAERVAYACYFDVNTSIGATNSKISPPNNRYPNATATYKSRLGGTTSASSSTTSTTKAPTTSTTTFLSSLTSTTTSSTTTSTTAPATSSRAVLITGNASSLPVNDVYLRDRLGSLGKQVTLVDDDALTTSAAIPTASVVVISSSVVPSKVPSWLATHPQPVLNTEAYVQKTLRMASSGAEQIDRSTLRIIESSHPLAAGRSGDVEAQSPAAMAVGAAAAGAVVVARVPGAATASLYGIEKGAALTSGTAPARRVGFLFSYFSPPNASTHGWAFFDAAVRWLD